MEFAERAQDTEEEPGSDQDSQDLCICTFALTGKNLVQQQIYICEDCSAGTGTQELLCCCAGCALTCHDGHNVSFLAHGKAYCDCHARGCCCLLELSKSECARRNMTLDTACCAANPIEMMEVHSAGSLQGDARDVAAQIADQCRVLASLSHDTFWIDGDAKPRCGLESIALEVYQYHVDRHNLPSGSGASGCEFWTQVKKAHRGVDLHYDKDEEIAALMEIGVYPSISTVTYLTQGSMHAYAPTVVFNRGADTDIDAPIDSVGIVFPSIGKHLAFNGALLHGAPAVLRSLEQEGEGEEGEDEEGVRGVGEEEESSEWRITFLVNVWIGHRPCGIAPLPEEILQSLSSPSLSLVLQPEEQPIRIQITEETVSEACEITIPFLSNKGVDWTIEENESALNVTMHLPKQIYELPTSYLVEYDESTSAHFSNEDSEEGGSEEDGSEEEEEEEA
jgi:hypothetical protein